MKKPMYIVVKWGVNPQGIGFLSKSYELAKAAAEKLAAADVDNHHHYSVYQIEVDSLSPCRAYDRGVLNDNYLFSICKDEAECSQQNKSTADSEISLVTALDEMRLAG